VPSMIRLNAGNDVNGNPRRAFVLLSDDGTPIGAWDEGYEGTSCVPPAFRNMTTFALTIPTTRSFLRKILRETPRMPSQDDSRVRASLCSCGWSKLPPNQKAKNLHLEGCEVRK